IHSIVVYHASSSSSFALRPSEDVSCSSRRVMSSISSYRSDASGSKPPSSSEQIRQEIQRFESVHPCIYQVYDLLEQVRDAHLQELIREQVVGIE
ncbi:hypothetical protein PRIPAC_94431, partial [Pristionchus pacificus]|uniref:Uncharacterized protein n=1 Tax=Pristionchus pacificus TaxID=54126 RepID=A0A2A6CHN7_PRIPA